MGSRSAEAYLASPAVVAASAVSGKISSPESLVNRSELPPFSYTYEAHSKAFTHAKQESAQVEGFVSEFSGKMLFCDADNLNTDGIYPGKYTYSDNMTLEDMAKVTMENYDPKFAQMTVPDTVLVSGYNFGTGSSREQAATSLWAAGVRLVVAASFSETFKRNAINNGSLVLECPRLISHLRSINPSERLLTRTFGECRVNLTDNYLEFGSSTFHLPPVGRIAQELVVEGGLENWVKNRIKV